MSSSYKLVGRANRPEGTTVAIRDVIIGGSEFVVAAGPCAVESKDQLMQAALGVAAAGARLLRAGAFKPRTSPYAFQGLGEEGLGLLALAGRSSGLPTVTEVVATEDIPLVSRYADALQVGARNMQNFALLKALGGAGKPVILKRGLSASIDELLMAAEYIVLHGNPHVVLCERGIRTFETATRNTLDLNAVGLLKQMTHLPVIVDPSHGTGRRDLIVAVSRAAVAVGADGLLIEVHPTPDSALSDGAQSITPAAFAELMCELAALVPVAKRQLAPAPALESHRGRIASIDAAVVRLLSERARLTDSVQQADRLPLDAIRQPVEFVR
jgi:3-deoxy-7-phosphoheptulonate synthase